MNQQISLNPKQLLARISRFRKLLTILLVVGLLGYAGYQISQISATQADPAYLAVKQKTTKVPNLRVNKEVLLQLQQLQSPGDTTIQVTIGKQNPFTFN